MRSQSSIRRKRREWENRAEAGLPTVNGNKPLPNREKVFHLSLREYARLVLYSKVAALEWVLYRDDGDSIVITPMKKVV